MARALAIILVLGCTWPCNVVLTAAQLPYLRPPTDQQLALDEVVAAAARSCDLTNLDSRVTTLSTLCTTGGACTLDCAVELLPLLSECRAVLDVLYAPDANFDAASDSCMTSIPSRDVLQRVVELHDAGQCPNDVLNGIAEVDVPAQQCSDGNSDCASLLAMGLLCDNLPGQCDATCLVCSACEDGNDNCVVLVAMGLACGSLVGQCDQTCSVCGSASPPPSPGGGGHRLRNLRARPPDYWRRTQGLAECDLSAMQENIANIDRVCCDGTAGVCAGGATRRRT
jgi:hypothetical protein